ncbi:outer membrane beta-barrel protein [Parafilimonas sp.]|uniref:outer membrane beta-barrel protein n=1 Tax=Parafilimonas sp. TaxID=1969739 RepID=UPI0039E456DF
MNTGLLKKRMLYNNDDFEKLFRKAAKGYPLKTDSADWEALSVKLAGSKKNTTKKNKWKYSSVAALLLALSIGSISIYKFIAVSNDASVAESRSPETLTYPVLPGIKKTGEITVPASRVNAVVINRNTAGANEIADAKDHYPLPIANTIAGIDNNAIIISSFKKNFSAIKINAPAEGIVNAGILLIKPANENRPDILQKEQPESGAEKEITADNAKDEISSAHISLKPQKRIYGMAYGGPEFSIVKLQKATNPGYRIGVAAGYKINDRLNVELGLQRERLDFYSNGKYMDTTLLKIKEGTDVEQAYASSKITSVPLKLKYSFWQKGNGHFFVGIGVNAVIITHSERYDYAVSKNGTEGSLSKKYSALTTPKYFSGLNFSGGYQAKVAGSWSVKAEPYYQVPVKNFGVAKIPVSNFGIDIGIVKDLK